MIYQNYNFPSYLSSELNPYSRWNVNTSISGAQPPLVNDETNQYRSGAVALQYERVMNQGSNIYSANIVRNDVLNRFSFGSASINCPMAILAVPMLSGCQNLINSQYYAPELRVSFMKKFFNFTSFYYILVTDRTSLTKTLPITREVGQSMTLIYSIASDYSSAPSNIKPLDTTNYPNLPLTQTPVDSTWGMYGTVDSSGLITWLNKVQPLYPHFTDDIINLFNSLNNWAQNKRIFFTSLMHSDFRYDLIQNSADTNSYTSTTINSNLPIYSIRNLDNMIEYFERGGISNADNIENLTLSKVNFKTDWKIYVKGAHDPEIFTTMASPSLNRFLASTTNLSGIQKSQIQIQYKIPQYTYIQGDNALPPEINSWQNYKTDTYDNTLASTWKSLVIASGQDPEQERLAYAQWRFRIYYNPQYFSSWCFAKIGFIGSPNIPDFQYMKNEGGVIGIDDGSTVTIIYDEYPPNNAYPIPDDITDLDSTETLPNSNSAGFNLLTTTYQMQKRDVQKLGNFLWSDGFLKNILLLNNSPIENIVGVKAMPCSATGPTQRVTIGNVPTEINGDIVESIPVITVGTFNYQGFYKSYLDLAPYTTAYLFLPFIGFKNIDPSQFINHTLTIMYGFDVVLGECIAMLMVDGIYFTSFTGSCGIDIPLVAGNRSEQELKFLTSTAPSLLQGDILGAAQSLYNPFHAHTSGNYSSTLKWIETRVCYIVLSIPNVTYPNNYKHVEGYPCNLTLPLSSLLGFTQCGGFIDLSGFTCTQTEKDEIQSILLSGFYI